MKVEYEKLLFKDRQRRTINYRRLRDAGFNSFEATRFKDFSDVKIDNLIQQRDSYNKEMEEITK